MAFRYPVAFCTNQSDSELKNEYSSLKDSLLESHVDVLEINGQGNNIKVNDTAIILNGTALMCSPNESNNLNAINLMRSAIKSNVSVRIAELNIDGAQLKGGDVLFTGQEIIVGLSADTNEAGAQAVAKTFPEYPTAIVKVLPPFKALRHAISVVGVNVLAVSENIGAKKIMKELGNVASFTYKVLYLPEVEAVDALYCNSVLLTHVKETIPESNLIFDSKIDYKRISVPAANHMSKGIHLCDRVLLLCPAGAQKNIASTIP